MRVIAEQDLLLRAQTELPGSLRMGTDEFRDGWIFVPAVDESWLEMQIRSRGQSSIRIDDGVLRSGVGDTSQEAIASALKLALRRISAHFNAVEVEHIELTQYPWFFLARMRVNPYRIPQSTVLPLPDAAGMPPKTPRRKRLPRQSAMLHPLLGGAMPMLKEMLILSRSTPERTQ